MSDVQTLRQLKPCERMSTFAYDIGTEWIVADARFGQISQSAEPNTTSLLLVLGNSGCGVSFCCDFFDLIRGCNADSFHA